MSTKPHVTHLVKLLTYVTQRNAQIYDDAVTVFHASEEEDEPLIDFIARLDENIRCSEACYATALVFIDRITEASSDLTLNAWTVQRLFSTSLLIANQFLDDTAERTLQFSRVTGLHPLTMANLKTEFLFRVQFRLHATCEDIQGYSDKLQGRFSTNEFVRLQHWDGTPKSAMALQVKIPSMRSAAPRLSPTRPRGQQNRAPVNTIFPQRNVALVAQTAKSDRKPFGGRVAVPMETKKRTRNQSQSNMKLEMVGDLATLGMDTIVV